MRLVFLKNQTVLSLHPCKKINIPVEKYLSQISEW